MGATNTREGSGEVKEAALRLMQNGVFDHGKNEEEDEGKLSDDAQEALQALTTDDMSFQRVSEKAKEYGLNEEEESALIDGFDVCMEHEFRRRLKANEAHDTSTCKDSIRKMTKQSAEFVGQAALHNKCFVLRFSMRSQSDRLKEADRHLQTALQCLEPTPEQTNPSAPNRSAPNPPSNHRTPVGA